MTFFVDANVLIYSATEGPYGAPCLDALGSIARGEADGRTSVTVLEEVWHVETGGRAGDLRGLTAHAYALFTPLLPVTDPALRAALDIAPGARLGANDRLHVATCRLQGIPVILSADRGFDAVDDLTRVDPLDPAGLRAVLNQPS
ncbi:MAG TPA: type II toxin-antitoxin system VapC family toxin [Acidimicrobiales bacterium]|nr:type II toxin-antitoxin system VapC family toxin [Acidimicrobiales bacterium]